MGIVRMGPPEELILHLAADHTVNTFVETGTYQGWTARWASNHFSKVITLEAAKPYFVKARQAFENIPNVSCLYGDSRSRMGDIVKTLQDPAIYWLDSHWCGSESYGEADQCPLLEEIKILNSSTVQHLIFIDDARLFTSPPPLPNRIDQWPTIAEVCSLLNAASYQRYVVIFEDVIVAVPASYRNAVANWCQEKNTRAWRDYGEQLKRTSFRRGIDEITNGIRSILQSVKSRLRTMARRS